MQARGGKEVPEVHGHVSGDGFLFSAIVLPEDSGKGGVVEQRR